ncbi:NAD-binding protein [Bacillus sp. H-16]|uniref:potassium channel family protein n=1 Tax=Alteribacter salitolerans TaxID=2912333 RepID=UPI0019645051|nr:potassium channel family protein [Alteribacter salitolerans]MBM7096275.1 NAD-binding protein [Alteribacter salitolerans]
MFRFTSGLISSASNQLMNIIRLLTALFLIILIFGTTIHYLEPGVYPDMFDGFWWAIVTISTVGYGDFVPESVLGRITGVLLILTGVGIFSFYLTNVATSAITTKDNIERGKYKFHRKGHIIIVGWNERTRLLLKEIKKQNEKAQVVLVDETLEKKPSDLTWVHFVRGPASHDQVLYKANIHEAHTAIITADSHTDEHSADSKTILSILTIKGVNPKLYTIAEIITESQIINARRAGADELVQSSVLLSSLMHNGPECHGVSKLMLTLLQTDTKNKMELRKLPEECIGLEYGELIEDWNFDGEHLLGIWRDDSAELLPPDSYELKEGDHLVVLVKKKK